MDIVIPRIEQFPVEAGHIKLFARAIGDPNPIYRDPEYAAASLLGSIIAPPTYTEVGIHFDEAFPFRPRPGEPWFGSAAEASGCLNQLRRGTDLHAGTHFTYHEPLRPGMDLCIRSRLGDQWEKEGRSGRLKFFETIVDYLDKSGQLMVSCKTTGVSTERTVKPSPDSQADAASGVAPVKIDLPPTYGIGQEASRLVIGDHRRSVVAHNLSRAQIIMYAGASGDFSPQHTDEVYNTQVAGYPSVFAHGMLTMAMTGRMLTDWVGDGRLRTFGFTFLRQVWPGDSLIAAGEVVSADEGCTTICITTINQNGHLVGKGEATIP